MPFFTNTNGTKKVFYTIVNTNTLLKASGRQARPSELCELCTFLFIGTESWVSVR